MAKPQRPTASVPATASPSIAPEPDTETPDLRLMIEQMRTTLAEQRGRLDALEQGFGELRLSIPRVDRTLTADETREVMSDDPNANFRVTVEFCRFGTKLHANSRIRATEYPALVSMVHAGLMITRETPLHQVG